MSVESVSAGKQHIADVVGCLVWGPAGQLHNWVRWERHAHGGAVWVIWSSWYSLLP